MDTVDVGPNHQPGLAQDRKRKAKVLVEDEEERNQRRLRFYLMENRQRLATQQAPLTIPGLNDSSFNNVGDSSTGNHNHTTPSTISFNNVGDLSASNHNQTTLSTIVGQNDSSFNNVGDLHVDQPDDDIDLSLSLSLPGTHRNNSGSTSMKSSTLSSASSSTSPQNPEGNLDADQPNNDNNNVSASSSSTVSSSSALPEEPMDPVPVPAQEGEEEPVWTIRKKLSASDVNKHQNRLLIEKESVHHIMNHIPEEERNKVYGKGFPIKVYDVSRPAEKLELKFTHWGSTNAYVLNGKWRTGFVIGRELKKDDTIGLRWDAHTNFLVFSVLIRAPI